MKQTFTYSLHGLHRWVGVFEGLRGYYDSGVIKVFRLEDHMRRFHRSAKMLYIDILYSVESLVKAVVELIKLTSSE